VVAPAKTLQLVKKYNQDNWLEIARFVFSWFSGKGGGVGERFCRGE
jgi:hypothetical protein